ncbi:MAG: PilN domain-containing protein [Proteobacteria bacterium]|nr:pilus assembly protein PilN [Desulfobacula sp.]MBU3950574.1 PilN domain-containing protein [Pseudomonadota bacterium]MBU4133513.1 PilN domain-containing protein [Pseudomonadota bacterium]
MIRINLLPFRLARKKENIRRQVSIFFLSLVMISLLLTWYTLGIDKKIAETRAQTIQVQEQIALYKEKADRVTEIKKKLQILEDKLKIVSSLEEMRKAQLVLMDEVSDKIVPEKMWIESLKADSTQVTLMGVAFDNPTIADFMRNLETSPLFSNIDLKRSKVQKFKDNILLKSFELVCTKKTMVPENGDTGKKGQ